jgi:hypothetical protein
MAAWELELLSRIENEMIIHELFLPLHYVLTIAQDIRSQFHFGNAI